MPLRHFTEAERLIAEAEESNLINDTVARSMRAEVEADLTLNRTRAEEQAAGRYDDAGRFGALALDEHTALTAEADALADAVAHGQLEPGEGRRRLDALLARHALAERRRTEFTAAADRVTAIDDDPLGYASEYLAAYPDARAEYSF